MLAVFVVFAALLTKIDNSKADDNIARAKELDAQKAAEGGEKERKTARAVQGTLELGGYEYDYFDRIDTYLLIGTDSTGEEAKKEDGTYVGDMADFLLLLVMNRSKQTYTAIQIDRDTMVDVPLLNEDGDYNATALQQICIAHWYGSDEAQSNENTVTSVSNLLGGLEIDGYYTLNMTQIPRLNHAIGGVEVTLEDDFTNEDPDMRQGRTILLSDEQAERFVRGRMGVGDGENTSRMRRQKAYMNAFKEKMMTRVKEESGFINDLYKEFMDVADTDLSGSEVSGIINGIMTYTANDTVELAGEKKKAVSESDDILHSQFWVDEEAMTETLTKVLGLEKGEKVEAWDDWMNEIEEQENN